MDYPKMSRIPSAKLRTIFNANYENKENAIKTPRSKHFETVEQYETRYEHWQKLLDIGTWSEFPLPGIQKLGYSIPNYLNSN